MARENFSQNIRASNTADGSSRQPRLDEVNRALAHDETSGLFEIYETPEPRSSTSMSISRTGSPLTSLPVSTAAGTPRRGTLLEEMRNALLHPAPFADEPYCYERTDVHCVGCTSLPVSDGTEGNSLRVTKRIVLANELERSSESTWDLTGHNTRVVAK